MQRQGARRLLRLGPRDLALARPATAAATLSAAHGIRTFSTTSSLERSSPSDGNGDGGVVRPKGPRERSNEAAASLDKLVNKDRPVPDGPASNGRPLRIIRVQPDVPSTSEPQAMRAPGTYSPVLRMPAVAAPPQDSGNIINVRSLPRRRNLSQARMPEAAGGWLGPPGSSTPLGSPRMGAANSPFSGAQREAGLVAPPPGGLRRPAGANRGAPGRGGGHRGGRPGRGGNDRRSRKVVKEEEEEDDGVGASKEEQEYLDAREMGRPMVYTPSLTPESLLGYGPAVPSVPSANAESRGQVECAVRAMRVLGGGQAFSTSSANHPDDNVKRLAEGRAIFFADAAVERPWFLANADLGAEDKKLDEARDSTRKAIVSAAVEGRYGGPPAFADLRDPLGTVAMFHTRDTLYKTEDARRFAAKVESLLPAAQRQQLQAKSA